ncbi:phage tail protein [Pseudoduganella sp. GCM10020061]|uniref:phage tail protein n=1 Tax=Pseudoduganella sp. GCM10020061 TaxID=3317345 RepID=UPI0036288B46
MFAGNFAPQGWALCNGQVLSIADNDALFSLIGTTYGGDGMSTFGLPDLQGRAPLHMSSAHPIGEQGGTETVTLTPNQMPVHTHGANASPNTAEFASPANNLWAKSAYSSYSSSAPDVAMNTNSLLAVGGNQPHENMMPSLAITYIICLNGIYPSFN